MGEKLIRFPQLLERIPVSKRTIARWEQKGQFPKRRRLSGTSVAWVESEVDQWIAERPTA